MKSRLHFLERAAVTAYDQSVAHFPIDVNTAHQNSLCSVFTRHLAEELVLEGSVLSEVELLIVQGEGADHINHMFLATKEKAGAGAVCYADGTWQQFLHRREKYSKPYARLMYGRAETVSKMAASAFGEAQWANDLWPAKPILSDVDQEDIIFQKHRENPVEGVRYVELSSAA